MNPKKITKGEELCFESRWPQYRELVEIQEKGNSRHRFSPFSSPEGTGSGIGNKNDDVSDRGLAED